MMKSLWDTCQNLFPFAVADGDDDEGPRVGFQLLRGAAVSVRLLNK